MWPDPHKKCAGNGNAEFFVMLVRQQQHRFLVDLILHMLQINWTRTVYNMKEFN